MWNSYFSFLDYLQIRRRIERRLSHSRWLFLHTAMFVIVPLVVYLSNPYYAAWWSASRPFLVQPWVGAVMFIWAVALMLDGLWTFFRSGAWGSKRSAVIEAEMRERVQNNDSYLVQDARDLFRLHGLLEDDIQRRANATIIPLVIFTIGNGLLWIAERGGTYSAMAWSIVPMVALLLLPILAVNLLTLQRHERKLREILAGGDSAPMMKPKRDLMHLMDDGELLEIVEEDEYGKRRIQ